MHKNSIDLKNMVDGKQLGPKARGQDLPHVDAYTLFKLLSTEWPYGDRMGSHGATQVLRSTSNCGDRNTLLP